MSIHSPGWSSVCVFGQRTGEEFFWLNFIPKWQPEFQSWQGSEGKPWELAWEILVVQACQCHQARLQPISWTECAPEDLEVVTSLCMELSSEFRGQITRLGLCVLKWKFSNSRMPKNHLSKKNSYVPPYPLWIKTSWNGAKQLILTWFLDYFKKD